ncbi:phosphatase [Sporosarcina sp. P26b]|uniref:AMP-binding protein n=1 Tax=Sporosarcina sp. P26b TaxID=2048253 RepID=UPI000C16683E|nr:AMP-binding protein [Sporosarcina sp. P26b]PIC94697.1 phosphatase [Sporosarcina sp. P26b]
MGFFAMDSECVAVITKDRSYSYCEIPRIEFTSSTKELIIILCENKIGVLGAYISALNSGHAVMLLAKDMNLELLTEILTSYEPKWIVGLEAFKGYVVKDSKLVRVQSVNQEIHADLAVLLSTSGTTGSQKFVRLSYQNLRANAESIIEYLSIDKQERAMMNLPLSYSYGMSIVNSHLLAGASVLLTDESVIAQSFWSLVKEQRATSLAGVPFTYQMLQRIGFFKMDLPDLKTLTEAGGRLNTNLVEAFGNYASENDKRFFVMYGQTEAAPRISYIPHNRVLKKSGSIGIAIPDGELSIDQENDELIYSGPNVMMGYAECVADLAKGDELNGVLHTGDTAVVDAEGYYTITGRLKRFIKLFGLRINLDEIERTLEKEFQMAVACAGNDDKLVIMVEEESVVELVKAAVAELYKLHRTAYKVKVQEIPRLPNGKIDYVTIKETSI